LGIGNGAESQHWEQKTQIYGQNIRSKEAEGGTKSNAENARYAASQLSNYVRLRGRPPIYATRLLIYSLLKLTPMAPSALL
jgi:hypothetical protein